MRCDDHRRAFRPGPLLGLLVVAAWIAAACGGADQAAPYTGYQRQPIPNVRDQVLPTTTGDEFGFVAPQDGLLLVYFGYTSCPDICPTTLSDLRVALADLGDDADRIQVAMVTIDPEIDTDEVIQGYVQSFIPTAVALRTEDEAVLRPVAEAFGADYGKDQEVEAQGEDGVFHTTALYAITDTGDLILTWSFGTTSTALASDLERLLNEEA